MNRCDRSSAPSCLQCSDPGHQHPQPKVGGVLRLVAAEVVDPQPPTTPAPLRPTRTLSAAGLVISPSMTVHVSTKNAARAITEGLRQEAGPDLRVTAISPGYVKINLTDSMTQPEIKAQIQASMERTAISPDAIAWTMAFAIGQPNDVDVSEIIVRPTTHA